MQAPKLIPFKQIKPVKFMGLNSQLPFTSLISQSKILYLCGRSLILQNIKTYQQKSIWTNQFIHSPQCIQHIINIHRQNIIGIGIRDDLDMYLIVIMNINSQINNYQHLNKKQRQKDRFHYLKNVSPIDVKLEKIKLLHQGSLFAVAMKEVKKDNPTTTIHIYSSLSGDLLYSSGYGNKTPLIQSLQLNRINYTCIIKGQQQQFVQQTSLMFINKILSSKQNLSSQKNQSQKLINRYFKVFLLNSSQLNSKNDFIIDLKEGESIIDVKFYQNHKKTFAFFLLNSGFVKMYMVNQRGFHDPIRIDARVDRKKHAKRMSTQKEKVFFSSQLTEENDIGENQKIQQRQFQNEELKNQNSLARNLKEKLTNKNQNVKKSGFVTPKSSGNGFEDSIRQSAYQQTFQNFLTDQTKYYYPQCICCTNCKVIIGYQECSFIGMISYSAVDYKQYKFTYIFDFFYQKDHIQSIQKINFSEDGCHCSVLVKVIPQKIQPSYRKKHSTRLQSRFKNHQKNNVLSKQVSLKYPSSKTNLFKKPCKTQKHALIDKSITSTPYQLQENQTNILQNEKKQYFQILHVDFISGIIEHEYHNQAIQQSLTKCSLKGSVQAIQFNKMNNTMLLLMSDGSLFYYYLNLININSDKEFLTAGRASLIDLRKKLQSNNMFFKQKSIQNYLSPQSIFLWVQKIKFIPFLLVCHPIIFELVLIFQDNVKFHFYNHEKLFESHHVLSLKNCKAASYSPFGDKLALGTVGSIWLVDSYTHQVIKKIPLVIFPTSIKKPQQGQKSQQPNRRSQSVFTSLSSKTISKLQFITNQDIIIQTGNSTLSMLLNYQKVLYYGSTQHIPNPQLVCYDYKHRLGVIALQNCVKIITKCNLNSKNKCEELAKVDLQVSSIKLCGQIDILFLGGQNGILYFIRWPQFFQSDNIKQPNTTNKIHLFHSPIVKIEVSINYKYLFALSKQGMIVICELTHSDQVEKIGKDVSFRLSKKIDLPLPLYNKWLISAVDEQKRAQNITKLMGNQAEIKNKEIMLADNYRNQLEKRSENQKNNFDQYLKSQIKKYQVDSGISKLQTQIAFIRDEIKQINGKRQIQSAQINQKIDVDLHKVFVERQKLQKQLSELQKKSLTNKSQFIKKQTSQRQQYISQTSLQIHESQHHNKQLQQMYKKKYRIDMALAQNMKQDFYDQKQQIQKYYTNLLSDIYQANNTLMSQNRNKKVQIHSINDKMRQLSARMYEMQHDLQQINQQREKVQQTKINLSQQIIQTDKAYHSLIKKTKQFQMVLNKIRTSSEACQMKYNEIQMDLDKLHDKYSYLERRREEAEVDFVEQFKIRNQNNKQFQELKEKIQLLKHKRKETFDNSVLIKDLLKMYEPTGTSHQKDYQLSQQTIMIRKSQQSMTNQQMSSLIQYKKNKTTKLTSDVSKWTSVKDDNKSKFIRYHQRLHQENNKLIFRFNQLQKQFKQWVILEKKIKNDILVEKQKQKQLKNSSIEQKYSFINGLQKDQNSNNLVNRQRLTHKSVHRESLAKNKLSSTSYHFMPKSLQRPDDKKQLSSLNRLQQPFQANKKSLLKQSILEQNKSSINRINKSSVKNLAPLYSQKTSIVNSQLKQNQNSLIAYHGTTLSKFTLKPKNKPICLSLHQSKQNQDKFITQY